MTFRARPFLGVPVGARVAVTPTEGPGAMLPTQLANLLRQLDRFRTADEHARALGATNRVAFDRGLQLLQRRGLLETPADLRRRLPTRASDPAPIALVAIPTRDRPGLAERAAASLAAGGPPVVVIDTSLEPQPPHPGFIRLGPPELAWLADQVGSRAHAAQAAKLALGLPRAGWQAGAARNAMTLLGAGAGVASLDDDVTAHITGTSADVLTAPFRTAPSTDPTEWWPASSVQAAVRDHPLRSADVIGLLGAVVGQPAEVLLGPSDDALDGTPATGERLLRGGRAVAVRAGLVGDGGWGTALPLLTLRGPSLRRLAPDDARWSEHATSRALRRAVLSPTLTATPGFMTPIWAVDLREIVPPAPPWGIASDAVWGALLHRVRPDAMIAWLPWAAAHRPPSPRQMQPGLAMQQAVTLRLRDVFSDIVLHAPIDDARPRERLRALGEQMARVARLAVPDLRRVLRRIHHRALSARLLLIERPLDGVEPAPGWLHLRQATCDAIAKGLIQGEPTLADVPSPEVLQRRIGDLATVLRSWPDLFDAAADCPDLLEQARLRSTRA